MYKSGSGFSKEEIIPPAPRQANPQIEILGECPNPTILLSFEAYRDTTLIIQENSSDEVSWLGSVREIQSQKYLIEKIFLFKQKVSGSSCEFDQSDIGKFYTEMLEKDRANRELLSSILFWGHLHPGGMTEPSTQDEDQMKVFSHNPFFIRGIFTRSGKCEFTFFDYVEKIKIVDCNWQLYIEDENRRDEIALEIKEKVSKKIVKYPKLKGVKVNVFNNYPPYY
ncbi:hypothetical protein MUP35_04015 [Patescibacteria group bacterium]|nr:hypothetical protein [Patescibacteria group bacterium]